MKTEVQFDEAAFRDRMDQLDEEYEGKQQEVYELQSDMADIDRERIVAIVTHLLAKSRANDANPAVGVSERAIFDAAIESGSFRANRHDISRLVNDGQLIEISTKKGWLYCLPSQAE